MWALGQCGDIGSQKISDLLNSLDVAHQRPIHGPDVNELLDIACSVCNNATALEVV
jgi:hypothetical protein